MKSIVETKAMRALSDLYREEAERIDSTPLPSPGVYRSDPKRNDNPAAVSGAERCFSVQGLSQEEWLSRVRSRYSRSSGVSPEAAWKIVVAAFGVVGLAGILAVFLAAPAVHFVAPSVQDVEMSTAPPTPSRFEDLEERPAESTGLKATPVDPARHGTKGAKNPNGRERKKTLPKGLVNPRQNDGLDFFKDCGMDPMCGFEKKKEAPIGRRQGR